MCTILQVRPPVTVPIVELLESHAFQPVFQGHSLSSDVWPGTRTVAVGTWAQQVKLRRVVPYPGGASDTWVRLSDGNLPVVDVLEHPDVRSSKMMKAKKEYWESKPKNMLPVVQYA